VLALITALGLAATGDPAAVRLILDRLPDAGSRFRSAGNSFYADSLAKPVALGDENMVRLLIENGAHVTPPGQRTAVEAFLP
jgi:hypothetical protein